MKPKSTLSRMTIDLSIDEHKQFKAMAAFLGKTMRELVVDSIQKQIKANQKIFSQSEQEQ
jgi:ParD-like antitoxin of type II ParDE toxin-antitoxin system